MTEQKQQDFVANADEEHKPSTQEIASFPDVAKILKEMGCELKDYKDPESNITVRLAIPTQSKNKKDYSKIISKIMCQLD